MGSSSNNNGIVDRRSVKRRVPYKKKVFISLLTLFPYLSTSPLYKGQCYLYINFSSFYYKTYMVVSDIQHIKSEALNI